MLSSKKLELISVHFCCKLCQQTMKEMISFNGSTRDRKFLTLSFKNAKQHSRGKSFKLFCKPPLWGCLIHLHSFWRRVLLFVHFHLETLADFNSTRLSFEDEMRNLRLFFFFSTSFSESLCIHTFEFV